MVIEVGRLKVSGAALLALLAAYFFDSGEVLFSALVSIAFHELGHVAVLRLFNRHVDEIRLELWGVSLRPDAPLSYGQELITTAAGPAMSFLLAVLAAWAANHQAARGAPASGLYLMAGFSLVFCVFNALPVYPLDGGKVLGAAAGALLGPDTADKILCVTSCAVIASLLIAGAAVLIVTRVNFSLMLAAVWLLIGYCQRSGIRLKSKRKNIGSGQWIRS
jgi:stage IV sporulation protein FB